MFSRTSTSALAVAACALFVAASASPDAFPFTNEPAHHQLVNRADVIITTGAGSDVQPRLEIGNLATRPDQWALYIKTMAKWKQASEDDTSGYYGVASIHGVPFEDWNGAKQCDKCTNAGTGYGTHDMNIFPTWHRCYVAHFEQEFLAAALEVAESYPAASRDRMVAAQKVLRYPYWDSVADPEDNSTVLPDLMTSQQITITGPDGDETLDNPLFSYKFTEAETKANVYAVFTTWLETYHYPNTNQVDAVSDNSAAAAALDGSHASLKDQVYQMLTACDDYLHFSNDQVGATSKCANSLESIHNTIHTLAGGPGTEDVSGGHLTYLTLSSFDPWFWNHHCNIDRLFALWQTINPDSYVSTFTAPHATWVIPSGATLNGDYPLEPFNKDASSYWTSNDVRDWTVFGYTYPEYTTSNGEKSDIAAYVNGLYGSKSTLKVDDISAQVPEAQADSTTPAKSPTSARGDNMTSGGILGGILGPKFNITLPVPTFSAPTNSSSGAGGLSSLVDTIMGSVEDLADSFLDSATGNAYEYSCNIQTPRYALNGSYYVYVFNGAPSDSSPATWLQDGNFVGMMGVLAQPEATPHHDLIVTGQIPLTRVLRSQVTLGNLLGMSEVDILPHLTDNLEWRISKNGVEVDVDSVEGFQASVYSSQASVPKAVNELPSYTNYAPQVDVTKGKTGGASKPIFGAIGDEADASDAPTYGSGSSASTSVPSETEAPSYSTSSPASTHEASPTEIPSYSAAASASSYKVSPTEALSYGSSSSSIPHEKPSATGPAAYSWGSYSPSALPYNSLDLPTSYATAPAGVIPVAFETWATANQVPETCTDYTTTVKHVETIYITGPATPSATAPVYSAPADTAPAYSAPSATAPVYSAPSATAPVYSAPSATAPVYSAPSATAPVNNAPVESAPVYGAPSATAPAYSAPVDTAPVYSVPSATVPIMSTPTMPVYQSTVVESVVPVPSSPVENSPVSPAPPAEYPHESKTVPAAPYPVPGASQPAYYPTGTGSPVAPVYPSGTGNIYPSSPATYTGAASATNVAGLCAGFGAIVAFFM